MLLLDVMKIQGEESRQRFGLRGVIVFLFVSNSPDDTETAFTPERCFR